jgi:hypothetical protein
MDNTHHSPSRLYDLDETGIRVVQHKHIKVVCLEGKRQIAAPQAAERGALISILPRMSPVGHYIPPLVIFPRNNMKLETMHGIPAAIIHNCHPSGWIQTDIFTDCFRHYS